MNIALTHLKDAEGHPPVERQVQITSLDGSCGFFFRLNLAISHKKGVVFYANLRIQMLIMRS